jgi:uncharacterized membrane protein YjjP (DUF1212 family)
VIEQPQLNNEKAIECFLLAGRIMMESGAETYRVEDTMLRMARSQNLEDAQSYVTPTGIIFSLGKTHPTRITSISTRITDLHRITLVNNVSRKLTSKMITLEEAHDELIKIEKTNYFLPMSIQVLAASIASAAFMIMFNGGWADVPAAMVAGGTGHYIVSVVHDRTRVKFFSEFLAALIVAVLATLAIQYHVGNEIDKIIIGSVMPLVPGLVITNAVRDLMAGHFIAGVAKGMEALLTAFAIGAGVALVLSF